MKTELFGYPIHLVSLGEALSKISSALSEKTNLHVVTLNPEMIMQGDANPELGGILKGAGLVIPDGAGVVWALKRQGHQTIQRLPGIELSEATLSMAEADGVPVAFVGAAENVLQNTVKNLQARFPKLKIVYQHHGFFQGTEDERRVAQACADSGAKIVFAALGVPKQEYWIHEFMPLFGGAVLIGVGGSFDVWSGLKRRAPAFFLKTNLEWLYRITSEPWRLQRIYKTLPAFALRVLITPKN